MDLDSVADELYGLTPSEFTPQRDARAAEARKAGDRTLATEVKKLRRPTTGAWLANLLVRERRDQVARLLDLGAALRRAQAALATDDLRRLSQERHRLLADLDKAARDLADRFGQPVGAAVGQELSATLEAALADPDAAGALRAGRLTAGLHYSGLGLGLVGVPDGEGEADTAPRRAPEGGPDDVTAAPARPGKGGREPRSRDRAGAGPSRQPHQDETEALLRNAEAALAAAGQEAAEKQRRLDEAREKRDRCNEEVADLERRLRALRKTEEAADDEVRAAKKALDAAEHAVIAARDQLVQARAVVEPSPSSRE
jgi:hypothetical protein